MDDSLTRRLCYALSDVLGTSVTLEKNKVHAITDRPLMLGALKIPRTLKIVDSHFGKEFLAANCAIAGDLGITFILQQKGAVNITAVLVDRTALPLPYHDWYSSAMSPVGVIMEALRPATRAVLQASGKNWLPLAA